MGYGKIPYLKRLQDKQRFGNTSHFIPKTDKKEIEGASPPSVFIGSWNYPKVFVGPLVPQQHGDTRIMDTPENWLGQKDAIDIIQDRFSLIRGKKSIGIQEDTRYVESLREMTLSRNSVEMETEFKSSPRGGFFHEDMQPFGPSAALEKVTINPSRMDKHMEKAHYDSDLKAAEAVVKLFQKEVYVSSIQKAISIGSFGIQKNRKLVPTRWSITMVDDTLSKFLLDDVKHNPPIENYMVFEHMDLNSHFSILLMPTQWQYEMIEAFIKVLGNEEVIFSDSEPFKGKSEYSRIGGCYYTGKMVIADKLKEMGKQAGAIVFRESYPDYTPLGVWLVREVMREALRKKPLEFETLGGALNHIEGKLKLPMLRFRKESELLKQPSLTHFL